MDLKLFPYGNAHREGSLLYCQHGADECRFNLMEGCAIQKMGQIEHYLPFIICAENLLKDTPTTSTDALLQSCASTTEARTAIAGCYGGGKGAEAVAAFDSFGKETASLDSKYIPWVFLNGAHSKAAEDDLLTAVCNAYTGTPKPAGCLGAAASSSSTAIDELAPGACVKGLDAEEDVAFRKYRETVGTKADKIVGTKREEVDLEAAGGKLRDDITVIEESYEAFRRSPLAPAHESKSSISRQPLDVGEESLGKLHENALRDDQDKMGAAAKAQTKPSEGKVKGKMGAGIANPSEGKGKGKERSDPSEGKGKGKDRGDQNMEEHQQDMEKVRKENNQEEEKPRQKKHDDPENEGEEEKAGGKHREERGKEISAPFQRQEEKASGEEMAKQEEERRKQAQEEEEQRKDAEDANQKLADSKKPKGPEEQAKLAQEQAKDFEEEARKADEEKKHEEDEDSDERLAKQGEALRTHESNHPSPMIHTPKQKPHPRSRHIIPKVEWSVKVHPSRKDNALDPSRREKTLKQVTQHEPLQEERRKQLEEKEEESLITEEGRRLRRIEEAKEAEFAREVQVSPELEPARLYKKPSYQEKRRLMRRERRIRSFSQSLSKLMPEPSSAQGIRMDPSDGNLYTFAEVQAHYQQTLQSEDIRKKWETMPEARYDPADAKWYTLDAVMKRYHGEYLDAEIKSYWETTMTGIDGKTHSAIARQEVDFLQGDLQENGCPTGYEHIDTATACEAAAQHFQRKYAGQETLSEYPKGCYEEEGQPDVWFNNHPIGKANFESRVVCQRIGFKALDQVNTVGKQSPGSISATDNSKWLDKALDALDSQMAAAKAYAQKAKDASDNQNTVGTDAVGTSQAAQPAVANNQAAQPASIASFPAPGVHLPESPFPSEPKPNRPYPQPPSASTSTNYITPNKTNEGLPSNVHEIWAKAYEKAIANQRRRAPQHSEPPQPLPPVLENIYPQHPPAPHTQAATVVAKPQSKSPQPQKKQAVPAQSNAPAPPKKEPIPAQPQKKETPKAQPAKKQTAVAPQEPHTFTIQPDAASESGQNCQRRGPCKAGKAPQEFCDQFNGKNLAVGGLSDCQKLINSGHCVAGDCLDNAK